MAPVAVALGCAGPFVRDEPTWFPGAAPGGALAGDITEKDIVAGDVNKDGYVDIIVSRKKYISLKDETGGSNLDRDVNKRSAILLLNEEGVFRDRTTTYTPWNDAAHQMTGRDVVLVDLDPERREFSFESHLDVVFVNTGNEQPRIYRNRGLDGSGAWLGFEDVTSTVVPALNLSIESDGREISRDILFCGVAAGDVDGDSDIDLYFSNYDPTRRTTDVLLINQLRQTGRLGFADETVTRLGDLRYSAFGTGAQIRDVNRDGLQDIIKSSMKREVEPWGDLRGPFVLLNRGGGVFHDGDSEWTDDFTALAQSKSYMFDTGDYDGDETLDIYEVTDDADVLHFGAVDDTAVSYRAETLSHHGSLTDGRGGNVKHLTARQVRALTGSLPPGASVADLDAVSLIGVAPIDVEFASTTCVRSPDDPVVDRVEDLALFRNYMPNPPPDSTLSGSQLLIPVVYRGARVGGRAPWQELAHDFEFGDFDKDGKIDIFLALCTGYAYLRGVPLSG